MPARKTTTGAVLESMVLPALRHGGYVYNTQINVGKRPGGGPHRVDVVAHPQLGEHKQFGQGELHGNGFLISLKWQQSSGTAEQKVPFEVICLAEAIEGTPYEKAYLVLGGEGWRLRDYYVGGGLKDHLRYEGLVDIVTLEHFIAKANGGDL